MTVIATSSHTYWWIALGDRAGRGADRRRAAGGADRRRRRASTSRPRRCSGSPGKVAGEHRQHPAAPGDGAGARADRGGGRRAGRLHERADRRVRWQNEHDAPSILLSVVLALVVVAVLAGALIRVRAASSRSPSKLGDARVGAGRRRVRAPAPARAGGQGDQRAVRRHPGRAARDRLEGGDRRREEAAMILVVDRRRDAAAGRSLPVVVYLLHGVLAAASSDRPERQQDR